MQQQQTLGAALQAIRSIFNFGNSAAQMPAGYFKHRNDRVTVCPAVTPNRAEAARILRNVTDLVRTHYAGAFELELFHTEGLSPLSVCLEPCEHLEAPRFAWDLVSGFQAVGGAPSADLLGAMLAEEKRELDEEEKMCSIEGFIKETCDVDYLACQANKQLKPRYPRAFAAVHASNMSKFVPVSAAHGCHVADFWDGDVMVKRSECGAYWVGYNYLGKIKKPATYKTWDAWY